MTESDRRENKLRFAAMFGGLAVISFAILLLSSGGAWSDDRFWVSLIAILVAVAVPFGAFFSKGGAKSRIQVSATRGFVIGVYDLGVFAAIILYLAGDASFTVIGVIHLLLMAFLVAGVFFTGIAGGFVEKSLQRDADSLHFIKNLCSDCAMCLDRTTNIKNGSVTMLRIALHELDETLRSVNRTSSSQTENIDRELDNAMKTIEIALAKVESGDNPSTEQVAKDTASGAISLCIESINQIKVLLKSRERITSRS